jgi:hypothetical protein
MRLGPPLNSPNTPMRLVKKPRDYAFKVGYTCRSQMTTPAGGNLHVTPCKYRINSLIPRFWDILGRCNSCRLHFGAHCVRVDVAGTPHINSRRLVCYMRHKSKYHVSPISRHITSDTCEIKICSACSGWVSG